MTITDAQIEAAGMAIAALYDQPIANTFRSMARAALEAAERVAWRPIETAPKDGPIAVEFFYAHIANFMGWSAEMTSGGRDERRSLGYWDGTAFHHLGTGHELFEFDTVPREQLPTHWRCLPSLPEEG